MKKRFLIGFNQFISWLLIDILTFSSLGVGFPLKVMGANPFPPALAIQRADNGQVSLIWTGAPPGQRLEQAAALGPCVPWRPLSATSVTEGDRHTVTLPASKTSQFFQLYLPPAEILPPRLCPIGDKTIAVGDTIEFDIDAVDPNRDPLALVVAPLPLIQNASYQPQNKHFSFTPSTDQHGPMRSRFW